MSYKSIVAGAGRLGGLAVGGPLGSILGGAIGSAFGPKQQKSGMMPAKFAGYPGFDWKHPTRGLPGFLKPGGFAGKGGRVALQDGRCPRGYHLNKHKLSDGTEAGSVCVRNRSMNALNGRAAMRAVRRVKRAEKLVRKLHIFKPIHRLAARSSCNCVGKHTCK